MVNRIEHIDIAKGISITLVAIFHSKLKIFFPGFMEAMSLFRMPLFFFLSGVFFSWSLPPKKYILKKSESLLKPYFVVLLFLLLIDFILIGDDLLWTFKGIFYGNGDTIDWTPLWFLTHLFLVYFTVYFAFRFLKFESASMIYKCVLLFILMVVGSSYIDYFWYNDIEIFGYMVNVPGLPFSLDLIFITSVYFTCGYLFRSKLTVFSPNIFLVVLFAIVFMYVCMFTDSHINLNIRIYENPFFATLGAISGIYIIISLSFMIAKSKILSFVPLRLGEASLYILIFHSYIQNTFYSYFSVNVVESEGLLLVAFISCVLSVTLPLIIKWFVLRNDYLALAFIPFKSNKLLQLSNHVQR